MYGLHYHGSEAAYLSGQFERAETLYTSVLEHAKTPLEQAVIYRAQMTQYQLQGRNAEVIALQHKSNQLLGWSMPTSSDEIQQSLDAEIEIVAQFLAHRSIDSILELPKMTDATIQEMLRILQILFYAAWLDGQPTLALLALAKMTTLSLHHGNSEMSPFGYVGYGLVANIVIKDVDQAYQFGYTAVQLCDQFDNPDVRGMTNFLFAADVHSWKRPLREADSYYENAYKYGMEAGNWLTVSFMMMISGSDRLTYGKTLEEFYPIVEAHVAFLKKIKSLENLDALTVGVLQPIRQLLGLTHSWSSFDDENFSEANYLGKYRDTPYHLAWFYSVKIRHAYLFEQVDSYLDLIPQANIVENTIPTHAKTPSTVFYVVLMHLALIETVSEPTEHWRAVQQLEAKLAHWGNDCPENISHKLLLIGAEKARLQGHMATAIDCYDQSIAQAQEQGYGYEAALANELAAKFYLQWGKKNVAAGYMQDAYYAYYRWGATAKLTDLETRYTQLLRPILKQSTPTTEVLNNVLTLTSSSSGSTYTSNHSSSSNSGLNETIDLKTVLKVSQLLAGTIQLKDLLKRLTEIILQNSGADHCALLLPAPNGTWQLRARATLERTTLCTTRLEDCVNLPVNLIHYVKNTRKTVILNTPEAQLPVADTYLNQQRPASIMCSPLLNQGNMLGIVFLSNQYTREVFHRDRTAILALLCSQAAISLENARLFVESQETEAALRESQQQMQKTANSLPGLIYQFQIDVGGQASFTYISERSAEILEFGPDILQQTADPMLQCIHLDDLPTFQQAVKESMENLTPFMWIGRLNLPSGQQRWIEARSMPSRQADGSHLWDGVILDVSARKAAEQSLTASESKFRRLLSNLDGVVYRCQNDENWTMEFMSDAITALSGYPVSDFINNQKRAYASIIHPDDIDFVGDVVVQGLEERQAFAVEYRIVHQDGSIRWVTEKGKGISGEMGELQYLEGVIFDISDRKAAEQKLLESQTFLKTVLDTFPLAVFWKDRESRFLGANQNFAQDAGFEEAEEMVGLTDFEMPWSEAESRASRADDRDVMVSDTPKLGIVETQTQTDGTQIWLETNKLPLHNLDGQVIGVLGTYQDISDRKQAEAAVLQKSAALEAAVDQLQNTQLQMVQSEKMATLGNLVAGVAHEINNPMGLL
ncbi:MAG: PAS domain-containing protein, partial [Cyanobacteria bacterium J06642_11]